MDVQKKQSVLQANERNVTHAELYRLAQAYALIRGIEAVSPPGASWQDVKEIPNDIMKQALAIVPCDSNGKILPSDKDFEAVRRGSLEI